MKSDLPSIEGVFEKDDSKNSSKEFAQKVQEGVEAYKEARHKKL